MMKRLLICVLALPIIFGVPMAESERARAFLLISGVASNRSGFLLSADGVKLLVSASVFFKMQ
jgi:hypothetical protein